MPRTAFEEIRPDDYLLRLAASDLGLSYKRLAAAELRLDRDHTVVDLGCGPGADLPALAEAVGAHGVVIGVDHRPDHIREARVRTDALPQVTVRLCDIHTIELPDDSVDRAYCDRVLQHVDDPSRVVAEARRVLRPGGRAVFAEPDWDTLVIDYADLSVARAYTRFVTEHVVRNACVGRQLPGLAARAGFTVSKVIPITTVFRDAEAADHVLGLRRVTTRAVAAEYLTARTAERWLDALATQEFFASVTLFITVTEGVIP